MGLPLPRLVRGELRNRWVRKRSYEDSHEILLTRCIRVQYDAQVSIYPDAGGLDPLVGDVQFKINAGVDDTQQALGVDVDAILV